MCNTCLHFIQVIPTSQIKFYGHGDNVDLDVIFLGLKKFNKNYIFVLHTLFTIKVQTGTPKLMYTGKKQINTGN